MNILLIHQNDDFSKTLSGFLTIEGHSTRSVPNQTNVFKVVESIRPDLVIIEVSVPTSPAIEIVQGLQRIRVTRSLPTIVISDIPELELELLYLFDFIHKPVDFARLRASIEMLTQCLHKRDCHPFPDQLSEEDFHKFHEFLVTNCGLHFEKRNIKMLERGLLNRMASLKISSFSNYYQFLTVSKECRSELQKLLQFLTVGETFFFRYHAHFSALTRKILPLNSNQGEQRPLRIWSAGCSTGEEPYSIAITVMESLPDWNKRKIKIIGTDINNLALSRAREGVYSRWKMRATENKYLDKYFKQNGKGYIVRDEVKSLVEFSHMNLQTLHDGSPFLQPSSFDAIFCRNVMIYFKTTTTRRVVTTFASSLKPGGALFLGHAETLMNVSCEFDCHVHDGVFYYTKKSEQPSSAATSSMQAMKKTSAPYAAPGLPKEMKGTDKTADPLPPSAPDIRELYRQGNVFLEQELFNEAEQLFGQILEIDRNHTAAMLAMGLILTNRSRFKDALEIYDRVLVINDLEPDAYYLRGLIYETTNCEEDAIREYRKAILLKMDFVMPHYQLGKLYFRSGQQKSGSLELKCSLKILEKCGHKTIIPYSGGLSREAFLWQLKKELISLDETMAA